MHVHPQQKRPMAKIRPNKPSRKKKRSQPLSQSVKRAGGADTSNQSVKIC